MLILLHNPRCSKSRMALEILQKENIEFKIRNYQDTPLTKEEYRELLHKLNKGPQALIRLKDPLIKEHSLPLETNEQALTALVSFPQLMERPILIGKTQAIVARPPQLIYDFIKENNPSA